MKTELETLRDRELDEARKNIWNKLVEIHNEVMRTNGRVNTIEAWKNKVTGGAYILLILSTLFGFMVKVGWLTLN